MTVTASDQPVSIRQPGSHRRSSLAAAFGAGLWFLIGFSDGVITYLMYLTEREGYLLFVVPIAISYFSWLFIIKGTKISFGSLKRQAALFAIFAISGLVHSLYYDNIHVLGYIQLYIMICFSLLIRDLFAENARTLSDSFKDSLIYVHYVLCITIIVFWVVFQYSGIDLSLSYANIHDLPSSAENKRISGLHREAAWTGLAVACSFLAIFFCRPTKIFLAECLFLVAMALSGSGSGLVLAVIFLAYQGVGSRLVSPQIKLATMALLVLLIWAVFNVRLDAILNGIDPSMNMRLASVDVAWQVIRDSFPLGTGYGNFRDIADYETLTWKAYINLDELLYYKSDVAALNLVAELGIFGCAILAGFLAIFLPARRILIMTYVVTCLAGTGTFILPYYLVMAAIAGLEIAKRRPVGAAR